MDPEQYAEAVERLEQEYVDGGMSANEYTRRRHELERRASGRERDPEPPVSWEPMPPEPTAPSAIPASGDPVTGAPLASWGRRAGGWFLDLLVYVVAFVATFVLALATESPDTGEINAFAGLLIFVVWFLGPSLYAWLMSARGARRSGRWPWAPRSSAEQMPVACRTSARSRAPPRPGSSACSSSRSCWRTSGRSGTGANRRCTTRWPPRVRGGSAPAD